MMMMVHKAKKGATDGCLIKERKKHEHGNNKSLRDRSEKKLSL